MRNAMLVSCLVLLPACSQKAAPKAVLAPAVVAVAAVPAAKPVPAPPSIDEKIDALLMAAIFGKDYRPASKDALARLRDPDDPVMEGGYVVNPVAHTVLASGETVLVANARPAYENGTAEASHASSGLLNVFILRQSGGKWEVIKRHENVASLGSDGRFDSVVWIMLGKDKPGMAVLHGGVWQGYEVEYAALFDLRADALKDLSGGDLRTHSGNEDGCDPEGTTTCWTMTGKWHMAAAASPADYDDLLINFSGDESSRAKDATGKPAEEREWKTISGSARYHYDGKQYRLIEGENPIPGV